MKSLQALAAAVVSRVDRAGNAEFWYLAISQLGPAKTWSQSTTKRARGIILCAAAGLWRRLVKRFEGWPWRLAAIANYTEDSDLAWSVAQELMDANECCLDRHFSLKLRKLFPAVDKLMKVDVVTVLMGVCFDDVVREHSLRKPIRSYQALPYQGLARMPHHLHCHSPCSKGGDAHLVHLAKPRCGW